MLILFLKYSNIYKDFFWKLQTFCTICIDVSWINSWLLIIPGVKGLVLVHVCPDLSLFEEWSTHVFLMTAATEFVWDTLKELEGVRMTQMNAVALYFCYSNNYVDIQLNQSCVCCMMLNLLFAIGIYWSCIELTFLIINSEKEICDTENIYPSIMLRLWYFLLVVNW